MTDLTASLKVTGTGFLAGTGSSSLMTAVLAATAEFCSEPENFPKFRRFCLDHAAPPISGQLAAMEPDFLSLISMALSPDGIHA